MLLVVLFALFVVSAVHAQVPRIISYQGFINSAGGAPVNGMRDLEFSLYDTETGIGPAIWSETHLGVHVQHGVFSVFLGSANPLDGDVDFSRQYWLGISIDGGPELSPRFELTASPYALNIPSMGAEDGQVLKWNATEGKWEPATIAIEDTICDGCEEADAGTTCVPWLYDGDGVIWTALWNNNQDSCYVEFLGVAKGNASNSLYGSNRNTHVNLGGYSITGDSRLDESYCTVSGGRKNQAWWDFSTVAGGDSNRVIAEYGFIGGGKGNFVEPSNTYGVVVGGHGNTATSGYSFIGGGEANYAGDEYVFIGGGYTNLDSAAYSVIVGGESNIVGNSSNHSFIGGGYDNTVNCDNSFIGGGAHNVTDSIYTVICGGRENHAYQDAAAICGGRENYAYFKSFVGGGQLDSASSMFSVVTGGYLNTASAIYSFIGGGSGNTTSGQYSTIGGGRINNNEGNYSTIAGGWENEITSGYSVIAGGNENTISGIVSFIGGGDLNTASAEYTVIGGGESNTNSGIFTVITGGFSNDAIGTYSFIGAGGNNEITVNGHYSVISGGLGNIDSSSYSFIGGGKNNVIMSYSDSSAISGGAHNIISGSGGFIGGGSNNYIASTGTLSVIGGGLSNVDSSTHSFIGGGKQNLITSEGRYNTIAGGWNNRADSSCASVGGGRRNKALEDYSTVCGGDTNVVKAIYSTISGGYQNFIADSGHSAVICGGRHNYLDGSAPSDGGYSAIVGGSFNTLEADHSLVFGKHVKVATADRVTFFDCQYSGQLFINHDDDDGAQAGVIIYVGCDDNVLNGHGASLTRGGAWTNGSSRTFKERFVNLSGSYVLNEIRDMEIVGWHYIDSEEYHIWPFAEDFYEAFGTGIEDSVYSSRHLAAADVAGVGLIAIQEITKQLEELRNENTILRERLDSLESLVRE